MATDPYLLERMRNILKDKNAAWTEKKMFGGDCFMIDDKMCFGLLNLLMPFHSPVRPFFWCYPNSTRLPDLLF